MLGAMAQEHQRVLAVAAQIAELTPISRLGVLDVVSANTSCLVDCVNRIIDPEGSGGLTNWTASGGVIARVEGGAPPGWNTQTPGYVSFTAAGGLSGAFAVSTDGADPLVDTFAEGTEFWVYCFAQGPAPASVTVVGTTSEVTYAATPLDVGSGWCLYGLSSTMTSTEGLSVELIAESPNVGDLFAMTGVTVVVEKDPQGPFSGDTVPAPAEQAYAYAWQGDQTYSSTGVRNHSRTSRFGTQYDLVAVAEAQSGLSLAPLGLSVAQRQLFLQQRFESRGIPWSSKLVNLIVELVQTEDPSFTAAEVTISVDAPDRSFTVSVNYNPNGALYQRIQTLIAQEAPAHLAQIQQVAVQGNFKADISTAGDSV